MRRLRALLPFILLLLPFIFPPTACAVRSDEFLCEDAVAKLQGCCANGTAETYQCNFVQGCTTTTYPDFDEPTVRCIISASCSQLQSGTVCGFKGAVCQ